MERLFAAPSWRDPTRNLGWCSWLQLLLNSCFCELPLDFWSTRKPRWMFRHEPKTSHPKRTEIRISSIQIKLYTDHAISAWNWVDYDRLIIHECFEMCPNLLSVMSGSLIKMIAHLQISQFSGCNGCALPFIMQRKTFRIFMNLFWQTKFVIDSYQHEYHARVTLAPCKLRHSPAIHICKQSLARRASTVCKYF